MTVTFIDRPCGFGKTNDMLAGLQEAELYLIVVPSLKEIERVKKTRPDLNFVAPNYDNGPKSWHLKALIEEKQNVVCTHSLYHINADFYAEGYLDEYNIVIDEVLDVVTTMDPPKNKSWEDFYLGKGYAEVAEDGKVIVTQQWKDFARSVNDTLNPLIYERALDGCLYLHNGKFFIWAISPNLVRSGKSCTVLTFKAEGSLMAMYLHKMGIDYEIRKNDEEEDRLRRNFAQYATIKTIDLGKMGLSSTAQHNASPDLKQSVARKLKKVKEVDPALRDASGILVTCLKGNWFDKHYDDKVTGPFAKGSRFANSSSWIANTTRGTNDYRHCDAAIYLWDQWMNPGIKQWLGVTNKGQDQYALSELLQWVYRTCLRDGKPATIYIPSARMRRLLERWKRGEI